MGYSYDKFKSYTISKNEGYWKIELNECENADYVFDSVIIKIDDFLETKQLSFIKNVLFTEHEPLEFLEENWSKEEAEQHAAYFVLPDKCLAFIKENHIIELLEQQKPDEYEDMIQQLRVLMEYWEQGYYVWSWY